MANPWEEADNFEEIFAADEKTTKHTETPKDNIIVLVDARKGMFVENEDHEVQIACALRAVMEVMKSKAVTDPSARVGVMLIGTKRTNVKNEFKGIYQLFPLDGPSSKTILSLQGYVQSPDKLDREIGVEPEDSSFPLDRALWACSAEFAKTAKATDDKRVWVFTNDDNPAVSKEDAIKRAEDSWKSNEQIILFPLQKPGRQPFNPDLLWAHVLNAEDEEADMGLGDAGAGGKPKVAKARGAIGPVTTGKYDDIHADLRKKTMRKRVYARVPFTIVDGVHIAVGIYNTIYPAKKPTASYQYPENNEYKAVKSETKYLDATTGMTLEEHNMMKYVPFGSKGQVVFTDAESKDMKVVVGEGRGLRLMGFKPKSFIKVCVKHKRSEPANNTAMCCCTCRIDNVAPPVFVYPSEKDVEGSTVTYRALWQKMLDRDVVAICRYAARDNAQPRFVALWPERERMTEDGAQLVPPGMYAIILPYADDIRQVRAEAAGNGADDVTVEKAKAVIGKVSLAEPYDPWSPGIYNPALQKFYLGCEAIALSKQDTAWDNALDTTKPPVEDIQRVAGEVLAEFREACRLSEDGGGAGTKSRSAAGTKKRKVEVPEGAPADTGIDWQKEVADGTVNERRITVDVLEAYCRRNMLELGGKKGDLLERVVEHVRHTSGGGGGEAASAPAVNKPARGKAKAKAAPKPRKGKKKATDSDDDDDAVVVLDDDDHDDGADAEEVIMPARTTKRTRK